MSKHTAGPWKFAGYNVHDDAKVEAPDETVVAFIPASNAYGQTQAEDARLIAAAPELLQSAKLTRELLWTLLPLFEKIDGLSTGLEYGPGMADIIRTLDAVIRKAEGR